jgi:hypothetical protein
MADGDDRPVRRGGTGPRRGSPDPGVIETLVVVVDDVVTALESNVRGGDDRAVLRATPPFNRRMRARLHVEVGGATRGDESASEGAPATEGDPNEDATADPVHVPPERLLAEVPAFPTPDDTEDALRAAGEYDPEEHRRRHEAAVADWRRAVARSVVDRVAVASTGEVAVRTLGDPGE